MVGRGTPLGGLRNLLELVWKVWPRQVSIWQLGIISLVGLLLISLPSSLLAILGKLFACLA
jgi:hypothetical protein